MNFILSIHAQKQIADRKIPVYILQLVLEKPQQIVKEDGLKVYQSQFDNSSKIQLIRVFVNDSVNPLVVVTVYVTSKIDKYWRQN